MGIKKTPGLNKRAGIWHIDKTICGQRICQSCGTSDLNEAEAILNTLIKQRRDAKLFGVRPERSFEEVASAYIVANARLKSIDSYISKLNQIVPYIGHIPIQDIHQGTLDEWVEMRREQGKKINTINHGIKIVRLVLNYAASKKDDNTKLTWLASAPDFQELPVDDAREPYPITWDEQENFLKHLPIHLKDMALFALNTGCRDQEICHLRWEWEVTMDDWKTSVFLIPGKFTKNGQKKYVFINRILQEVLDRRRSMSSEFVFSYRGNGLYQINNTGWQTARAKAGLGDLHVHDLRHTFSTRLYGLGVPHKDIRMLMGHSKEDITDEYIHASYSHLSKAVAKLEPNAFGRYPNVILLREPMEHKSRKYPTGKKKRSAK